jgi:hypothetical protein
MCCDANIADSSPGTISGLTVRSSIRGQEGVGYAVGEVKFVEDANDFRGEFGDEVVADKGGHLEGGTLVGVGGVIESVRVDAHADEPAGGGSGEIADGEGAAARVGAVNQSEGESVCDAAEGIGSEARVVARVFSIYGGDGEVGETTGGVDSKDSSVIASEGAGAVAPVVRVSIGRPGHVVSRLKSGKEKGAWAECGVNFLGKAPSEGEGARGLGIGNHGRLGGREQSCRSGGTARCGGCADQWRGRLLGHFCSVLGRRGVSHAEKAQKGNGDQFAMGRDGQNGARN